ncbi:MAG: 16S rRNA (guanine(527)-N(7))-methyltransferase RsmG [Actinomycetota bacterium]|nr:16S rRNA (guanine(527)-N(7))-methyltransferase RsmG [Actinomycetota bacterium]
MKHGEDRRELLRAGAPPVGLKLSDEGLDKLLSYEDLLRSKALPLGFIAASDSERVLERHVLDSMRAAAAITPADRSGIDLGSGAGLPGVVLGLISPAVDVLLVESQRRRVAFLELVLERVGAPNLRVFAGRAEELPRGTSADLCFARAFAPMERSWAVAEPLLSERGRLVYFAGSGTQRVPAGARITGHVPPTLESSGPVVIMGR